SKALLDVTVNVPAPTFNLYPVPGVPPADDTAKVPVHNAVTKELLTVTVPPTRDTRVQHDAVADPAETAALFIVNHLLTVLINKLPVPTVISPFVFTIKSAKLGNPFDEPLPIYIDPFNK